MAMLNFPRQGSRVDADRTHTNMTQSHVRDLDTRGLRRRRNHLAISQELDPV